MKKIGKVILWITVLAAIGITGYTTYTLGLFHKPEYIQEGTMQTTEKKEPEFISSIPDGYDSMDPDAVVLAVDLEGKKIVLQNMLMKKSYTLDYSQATRITDKYGISMSMAQVQTGDIVEVTFLKSKKRLNTLSICSGDVWCVENTSDYTIDRNTKVMMLGKDGYRIEDHALLFSDGKRIDWMDINTADVLSVRGVGTNIYSIVVEKGHGYLRLEGDEYFVGGWIEVGEKIICPIKEDMLLTVPEGTHQVSVSKDRNHAVKQITVARGEEVTLDLSDVEIEQIKVGRVLFTVTPGNAAIYVDGDRIDTAEPIELDYGVHQMIAGADGYETMTRYIRVGQELASLDVVLEKKQTPTVSGNDKEEQQPGEKTEGEQKEVIPSREEGKFRVFVSEPKETEVYLDGAYIGLTPVSFPKTEGSHVITLRKSGYQDRSYPIQIDGEEKDISFSFTELTKE